MTVCREGMIWLWDVSTSASIGAPMKHDARVVGVSFSPGGNRLLTASANVVWLWDAHTGAPIDAPVKLTDAVNSAVFSPDGSRIVTTSIYNTADNPVRLWDARTGAPLGTPMEHARVVDSADFSPDGSRVVTASADGTARLWDARTGASLGAPMKHDAPVDSAVFSPDGHRVVTTTNDGTARLWDGGRSPIIGSGSELARQACAVQPYNVRNFSATPGLRLDAQIAFLDPDAPGPCDRYGLLSHHYWFGLAKDVWKGAKDWWHSACAAIGLCERRYSTSGQEAN